METGLIQKIEEGGGGGDVLIPGLVGRGEEGML